ncbi:uncharacterized protein [Pyrus communis]|uniref:uncharacterized protein n=1 Tax=Pyrus communis TaxID=23211 RepID=UPI0035C24278
MEISLRAKNKLGFFNGDVAKSSSSNDLDTQTAWRRCNNMIISWLLHYLEADLAESIIFSTTAKAVWYDLSDHLSQRNTHHIFQLNRELATISQGTSSVFAYFTHLKGLWDELALYNDHCTFSSGTKNDRQQLMQFLMGLNESFSTVRDQILLMNPLPIVCQVCSFVSQVEKQRSMGSPSSADQPSAIAVHGSSRAFFDRPHFHCTFCNYDFHTRENCHKFHGYPVGHHLHGQSWRPPCRSTFVGPSHNNGDAPTRNTHITNTRPTTSLQAYTAPVPPLAHHVQA